MPRDPKSAEPRHFFLNERHELRGEKGGGGRIPEFVGIDWQAKGTKISDSLQRVENRLKASADPLSGSRYFVMACPAAQVTKKSEDKRKAPTGEISKEVAYSKEDSRVFGRLGMDLIQVNSDGSATVHARSDRFEQLTHSSSMLADFGRRERSRWATLDSFDLIPQRFIVDKEWLEVFRGETRT